MIEIAKIGQFGEFLKTWSLRSNSVTKQVKNWWKMPKLRNSKLKTQKCDILSHFQTMCSSFFHFEFKIFATFQVLDKSKEILHRMTKELGKSVEKNV